MYFHVCISIGGDIKKDLFGELTGRIRICDPYLNDETLNKLRLIKDKKKVEFLFAKKIFLIEI